MKKIIFFAVAISLFAIHGCQKDPVAPINEIKIVDNLSISAIEANISGSFECPVAISKIELWIDSIESSTNPQKHAVSIDNKNISLSVAPLYPGTTYYYRYVAYNEIDTLEMEEKSFTTEDGTLAAITTSNLTQIGAYSAVGGGNVSSDGYFEVTERGVCWSTSPNPTTDNNKTIDGEGIGSFSSNITNLSLNTTYYVRAYATNAKGTVYGEQKKFTTNSNEITVKTSSVYNITANTATCGGEVSTEGTQGITARGVCWHTASNPTIANSKTIDGSGSGVFLSNITGLAGNTKYYVRAYATNSTGTVYGEEISFTTTTIPTVTTNTVTSIKATTLVCGGNVTSDGNATVTERGLCWSTSPNPTINGNKTSSGSGTGSFSITITGLNENTTYYIRAYATNSNGTAYGDTRTAQTQSTSIPSVTTANVTSITANSAVCGGNVTSDGYSTVTARGVCWSTSPNPTISNNKTTNGSGTGSFTSNITGLTANTTYYVRAYATNSKGTAYGEEKSFTFATTIPTVTTNTITSITPTSLVCGGNVTSDGNATVTERGLCWSTSPNFTGTTTWRRTGTGTGTGSFSTTITGLSENTTYYIRAYATNSNGTAYGDTRTAQTPRATIPSITTANVTSITPNSAVCGGNVTSDGGATVTARGVCWSTSPNPTINNSKTTNGSGTGSFISNITGLTDGTTYYVRAYATNSNGTAYGEENSFTTASLINGHDWVDLGLPSGLKWATCNVGATTPEGYGNYYAWGETTTKTSYDQSNSVTYGQQISDISGNATYDAARANWGSTWRMPTKAEMQELVNNCTCTWTTQNGVNGMRVTGPNGNSIFLPAAGSCYGSSPNDVGGHGYYWGSTPFEFYNDRAYELRFNSGYHDVAWYGRSSGLPVRPVSN